MAMSSEAQSSPDNDHDVRLERGTVCLIDRIAPEWRALCAEGPCDEPFYDPDWVRAYVAEFGAGAGILLLNVRRNGKLRAVLPLVERSIGIGPARLRWLSSTSNSHFPRFDVVHGVGDGEAIANALWKFLEANVAWDLLQFESAPEGGVAWHMLALAAASNALTRVHRPDASPYIDLRKFPPDLDGIISSLPPSLRSQNRRSLKRLRARGSVRFRMVGPDATPAQRDVAMQSLFRLEASGWKGRAKSAIVSDPVTERFYGRIIANAAKNGALAICELRCNDDLVASKLNLIWNGTMYELKSGINESYRECSPGHLIKAFTIEAAVDMHLRVLDNCGRSDPHKVAWTPLSRPFATCFIGNRTIRARLAWSLLFRAGPWVREHMSLVPFPRILARMLG
jgi:CelD/BcsL family acetyltransferase involved in cellulose biosynthesis